MNLFDLRLFNLTLLNFINIILNYNKNKKKKRILGTTPIILYYVFFFIHPNLKKIFIIKIKYEIKSQILFLPILYIQDHQNPRESSHHTYPSQNHQYKSIPQARVSIQDRDLLDGPAD